MKKKSGILFVDDMSPIWTGTSENLLLLLRLLKKRGSKKGKC